ncbi:MAG: Mur ligase family protein [Acidimicrobiales bacterium]
MTITLAHVEGRTIDLLGAGIDNTALLPHLSSAARIRVWVDEPETMASSTRTACAAAGASVGAIHAWSPGDLIVRSPGFPPYRADIASALSRIPPEFVTTAVNLWLESHGRRFPIVIITGTKGKSTVARMLASILPTSALVGNIGTPIWSLDPPVDGTPIVCEISSYQAVNMTHRADLGVLTSLSEDHVSWHGSVERYQADKLGPVRRADRALTISGLVDSLSDHPNLRTASDASYPKLDPMPGHMATNARLALTAADWLHTDLGVSVAAEPDGVIAGLPPMIGRLRELASPDAHRWFDDSLASNPSGAAAAVMAFTGADLWLILGGIDRHVSPEPLIEALRATTRTISAVAVPDNGRELIGQIVSAGIELEQFLQAPDVAGAVSEIRSHAVRPSTVLFSPGAPTPPQHQNWSVRSAAFEAAVVDQ